MRPYFAIIKDSFRAALASRVLYVLLGLITILLLVIAPFHAREVLDWKLQYGDDVRNPITLVTQLIERKENRPEVKRIFDLLPEKTQDRAEEIYKQLQNPEEDRSRRRPGGGRRFGVAVQMINDFNKIIEDKNFYREEDWKNKLFSAEIEALLEEGVDNLSEERLRRLNRLLICAAFPSTILTGSPTALDFYYGVWKWDDISAVLTPTQLKSNMGTILPYVFDKFILSIGLAVAILVTANIIPETFNPGSLNLLLSKPVSRWALYLAKFFGGCTFIALCSVYLFFGTWLWIGLALGIWDKGLLWGIPLYILVFAIYYSVSALVGLSYRSSIMAIIVTILFWAFCFVMGTTHGFLNTYMTNKNIISITPIGDQLVSINGIGQVSSWDDSEESWVVRSSGSQSPQENMALNTTMWFAKLMDEPVRLQPVFDPSTNRVYTANWLPRPVNPLSMDYQNFYVGSYDTMELNRVGKFPRDSMAMFGTKTGLLVVNSAGRFAEIPYSEIPNVDPAPKVPQSRDPSDLKRKNENSDEPTSSKEENSNEQKMEKVKNVEQRFVKLGPTQSVSVTSSTSVDYNYSNQEIAIFNYREGKHRIIVYSKKNGKYSQNRSVEIDTGVEGRMNCRLAYQGDSIVVVVGNGQVILLDAETLEEQIGYRPETGFGIETVKGSRDGRWFGLRYSNQTLWMLDTKNRDVLTQPAVTGQGSISAFSFGDNNELLVADRTDRVTSYSLDNNLKEQKTASPFGGIVESAFRWGVKPFYNLCPKPGEFYRVVTHLSTSNDEDGESEIDLTLSPKKADPFAPLWSGLGFMAFLLSLACLIFHYKDF